jgi:hypothetical protein
MQHLTKDSESIGLLKKLVEFDQKIAAACQKARLSKKNKKPV